MQSYEILQTTNKISFYKIIIQQIMLSRIAKYF